LFSLAMYSSSVPLSFYSSFTHSFLSFPSSSFTDTNYLYFLITTFSFLSFHFSLFLIFFLFYVFLNLKYHFSIPWLSFFLFIFCYSHLLLNPFCYILSFLCSPLLNFMLVLHLHAIYPLVSNITYLCLSTPPQPPVNDPVFALCVQSIALCLSFLISSYPSYPHMKFCW